MKCFTISDNTDTLTGMRLAGVEGIVVHEKDEVLEALKGAVNRGDIATVFITGKLRSMCEDEIADMKLNLRRPLIVEIPDRHGDSHIAETLAGYVSDAVGIRI